MAFADGHIVVPMLTAQDHKRVGNNDTGPNTGMKKKENQNQRRGRKRKRKRGAEEER